MELAFTKLNLNRIFAYFLQMKGYGTLDDFIYSDWLTRNKYKTYHDLILYNCELTQNFMSYLICGNIYDVILEGEKYICASAPDISLEYIYKTGIHIFSCLNLEDQWKSHTFIYEILNDHNIILIESDATKNEIPNIKKYNKENFEKYINQLEGDKKIFQIEDDSKNIDNRINEMINEVKKYMKTDEGQSDEYFSVLEQDEFSVIKEHE